MIECSGKTTKMNFPQCHEGTTKIQFHRHIDKKKVFEKMSKIIIGKNMDCRK